MTSHRALLLTLIQIPLISSLPHRPHEREHGLFRSHDVKGAIHHPQVLAAEDYSVSTVVNTYVIPTSEVGLFGSSVGTTMYSAPSATPVLDSSVLPDTTVTEQTTYTSTITCSTDSSGFPVFPTEQIGSVAPFSIVPPSVAVSTGVASAVTTSSAVVSSSESATTTTSVSFTSEISSVDTPTSSLPPPGLLSATSTSSILSAVSSIYSPTIPSVYSAPVYSTWQTIPSIYSTVSGIESSSIPAVSSPSPVFTETPSSPIAPPWPSTYSYPESTWTVETTATQSESFPSPSLIFPSQTIPFLSTAEASPSHKHAHKHTRKSSKLPAVAPTHSAASIPPALSFETTHSLAASSTISLTLATTLTISEIQTLTSTTTVSPGTTGIIVTSLNTHGQNTLQPFDTTVLPPPSKTIRPITTGPNKISHSKTRRPTATMASNIFVPIAKGPPPSQIPPQGDHPVPPLGIEQTLPLQTNKFYANFFLSSRTAAAWTHPYSIAWVAGQGNSLSWGLSISYQPRPQIVYGPGSPPEYYLNAVGIQPVILSARELGATTDLTMDELTGFSCNINLATVAGATPVVTFPLVQGMGFVTAVYNGGTPFIQSGVFFNTLMYGGMVGQHTARYLVTLADATNWFVYITANAGSPLPTLTLANSGEILGSEPFAGTVQAARVPDEVSPSLVQGIYDAAAGVYPITADVQASVSGSNGEYQLSWTKAGLVSKTLLMFALPHHVQSFSSSFKKSFLKNALQLWTTTKGIAIAVAADAWSLYQDDIPYDMGFAPWSPKSGSQDTLSASAVSLIQQVAAYELTENFTAQTDLDSMYFSGKGLAKFAFTVYAANDLANDTGVASAGLVKLKQSFATFVNNQQIYPLVYDTVWGGAVSSCSYTTGDSGCDFGNTYYNDHHFHYGYFVYTAAVIGYLDPSWLHQGTNKAWVNMLVRDFANPVTDKYFPFQRMFDWYHGHSWAHGLYETFDGKDQESSSEDAFSSYAIKMWGRTIGDANMEARGNLQVAIQARSLQNYYLMTTSNKAEPPSYLPNKASGILFENKIDHTTYFGTLIEYIEGIHMLPLNPSSTLTRDKTFVRQEWDTYFNTGYVDTIESGWRGILMANYAIIEPVAAYNFFAQTDFNMAWLDSGASRTWYLAYSAGLGGAPS